jgi:anti-sigma factor RsiW
MDIPDNDILISAYLDGELTADEMRRVEELLATSAEARQSVDELRAIRAGLKELPQHKLGPDFAADVLRRVAAEEGAESSPPGRGQGEGAAFGAPVGNDSQHPNPLPKGEGIEPAGPHHVTIRLSRFWKNPRSIGWSAVAIAVAVMILVTNRRIDRNQQADVPQGEREVARAPEAAKTTPSPSADNRGLPTVGATKEPLAKGRAGGGSTPQLSIEQLRDSASSAAVDAPTRLRMEPKTGDAAPSQSPISQSGSDDLAAREKNQQPPKGAEVLHPTADKLAGSSEASRGSLKADAAYPPSANAALPATTPAPIAKDELEAVKRDEKVLGDSVRPKLAANADVVVVEVELTPEAARRGDFEKLLQKHDIVLEEGGANRAMGANGKLNAGESGSRSPDQLAQQNKSDVAKLDEKQKSPLENESAEPARGDRSTDVFLVDASPQQISETISALEQSPQLFPGVSIRGKEAAVGLKRAPSQRDEAQLEGQQSAGAALTAGGPRQPAITASDQNPNRASQLRLQPGQQAAAQDEQQKEAKKQIVQQGTARRLSRIDVGGNVDLSAAADQKALTAGVNSSESRKLDTATGKPEERKPGDEFDREKSKFAEQAAPLAPLGAEGKSQQPVPPTGSALGGAGGFGGGAPAGKTSGGRFAAPSGVSITRSQVAKGLADSTEHRQQAVFVLRVVGSPTSAAAVAPPTNSDIPSESSTKVPAAAPAKPAESGR